jgi:hypothetical protein
MIFVAWLQVTVFGRGHCRCYRFLLFLVGYCYLYELRVRGLHTVRTPYEKDAGVGVHARDDISFEVVETTVLDFVNFDDDAIFVSLFFLLLSLR